MRNKIATAVCVVLVLVEAMLIHNRKAGHAAPSATVSNPAVRYDPTIVFNPAAGRGNTALGYETLIPPVQEQFGAILDKPDWLKPEVAQQEYYELESSSVNVRHK